MVIKARTSAVGLTLTLIVSALSGCSAPAKSSKPDAPLSAAPGAAAAAAPAQGAAQKAAPREPAILKGKVVEAIDAGAYTYLRLEKDGKSAWSAVPAIDVKLGEEVELIPGMDMGRFSSPSMKRTFEEIHFSAGLKQSGSKEGAALPPGHTSVPAAPAATAAPAAAPAAGNALPPGHPGIGGGGKKAHGTAPAAALLTGKIVETSNAGGYTYLCLEKDGKRTWAAIPATEVTVGSEISLLPGSEMTDFNSPTLKRSFESIVFSPGPAPK